MIYSIQMLRGVASLMVFWGHLKFYGYLPNFLTLQEGAIGVDLFFVISGFIMGKTLHNQKEQGLTSSINFFTRRLVRVFPVYIIVSLTIVLFNGGLKHCLISLFLIPIADANGVLIYPFIAAAWTLSFELVFYLIIAILLCVKKYNFVNVILTIFTLFLLSFFIKSKIAIIETIFSPILLEFSFGLFIYEIHQYRNNLLALKSTQYIFLFISLVLFLILKEGIADGYPGVYQGLNVQYQNSKYIIPRWLGYGIPSALLVYSATLFEKSFRKFSLYLVPFVFLGDISYSLYLCHTFLIGKIKVHLNLENTQMFLIITFMTISVSAFLYLLIEKPISNMSKKLLFLNQKNN